MRYDSFLGWGIFPTQDLWHHRKTTTHVRDPLSPCQPELSRDRIRWRAFVMTVMKLWVLIYRAYQLAVLVGLLLLPLRSYQRFYGWFPLPWKRSSNALSVNTFVSSRLISEHICFVVVLPWLQKQTVIWQRSTPEDQQRSNWALQNQGHFQVVSWPRYGIISR